MPVRDTPHPQQSSHPKLSKASAFFIHPDPHPRFSASLGFAVQRFGKIKQSVDKIFHRHYFVSIFQYRHQGPAVCPSQAWAVIGFPVNWRDAAHADIFLLLGNTRVMSSYPWADGYLQLKWVCCDLRNKRHSSQQFYTMVIFTCISAW